MTTGSSDLFADAALVSAGGRAVIYGAGGVGRDLFAVLRRQGISIRCVIDRAAMPGQSYQGVPMYALDSCPLSSAERAGIPVVIGIFNRDVDIAALARALHDAGFGSVVSFVGIHARFPDAFGDRFWLTRSDVLSSHRDEIARVAALLADDRSRRLFGSLVRLRESGRYDEALVPHAGERQYLPADVPGWLARRPVRFVDCGAYRGDTLEDLLAAKVPLQASAHFEPDIDNFAALAAFLRLRLDGTGIEAVAWPCAVDAGARVVGFQRDGAEAGTVSAAGAATVPAVALDEVLIGWRPSFIKMDIEGSELDALSGARRLIAAGSPSLAICVYHRPDHLWRIPLLLSSWPEMSAYRYYLRAHGFDGFDTVLYANPSEVCRD
jgi:FkbM family methyltransferase